MRLDKGARWWGCAARSEPRVETRPAHPRRLVAALLAAGLAAVSLARCASGTGAVSTAATGSRSGAFPVTIPSALGTAVIPAKPERVVTIGWGTADTAVALGTIPAGMEAATWGGDSKKHYPWVREAIEKKG